MVAQLQLKYYSPKEYLELEEKSDTKNEYLDGEIIPMAGGTTNHNQIAINFCRAFPLTIGDRDYYIYINDVKLWIPDYRFYTYPDLMIIEGKPIYQSENSNIVTNPKIIIEVLSDSTQNYDKTEKFRAYRSLSSIQEYILISQSGYYVEQFIKQTEQQWLFNAIEGENNNLVLASVDFSISFSQLYQRIVFE
ncbi:Uma2 family endonuclease [Cyanobacterium aponinum FACHB-4101]|uniref:Uma2 family endonuclease n=1 Tax=Cyanobacterium aponinum TaxID=379064 RepID=UPI0016805C6D|nr:Uma2 family endonuclease [Cyanobacterium aponinum]MBD2395639.1 Uma2 family endonuclease [Cyanobacterium aponinum FACHB-4101]